MFDLTANSTISVSSLINAGLLEVTGAAATATVGTLDNIGTISVAGTLFLNDGGILGGTITGGGAVLLGDGVFVLNAPTLLEGTRIVLARIIQQR